MKKSIFEQFYNATEEFKKSITKPVERRKLERRYQEHYDLIAQEASNAVSKILDEYKKIGTEEIYNINVVIDNIMLIKDAKENQKICAQDHKNVLGYELKGGVTVESIVDPLFNEDGSLKTEVN